MKFVTDYKLESYIINENWEGLSDCVRERMKGCMLDLFGALASGSRSLQFKVGLALAKDTFKGGGKPVIQRISDRNHKWGADEVGLATIVCADSVEEVAEIAKMGPNLIVAEPTELIGTGVASDMGYVRDTIAAVKAINPDIMVLQGAGISNGQDIYFRVAFKPVATVLMEQPTVTEDGEATILKARGRHDACVLPRAVPVVEAMAAMTILDYYLLNQAHK